MNNNLPQQPKKTLQKANKTLKNGKDELVVGSIVINTLVSIINLIITLVMISRK